MSVYLSIHTSVYLCVLCMSTWVFFIYCSGEIDSLEGVELLEDGEAEGKQ